LFADTAGNPSSNNAPQPTGEQKREEGENGYSSAAVKNSALKPGGGAESGGEARNHRL